MPSMQTLFLLLALAFTVATILLTAEAMNGLEAWFESLSPVQQYWLPRLLIPASALLAALGGVSAYRRRLRAD